MKRSISAFEPGAVMEPTAFPFRNSTRVGMISEGTHPTGIISTAKPLNDEVGAFVERLSEQ